jgi:hypothetical protein
MKNPASKEPAAPLRGQTEVAAAQQFYFYKTYDKKTPKKIIGGPVGWEKRETSQRVPSLFSHHHPMSPFLGVFSPL